MSRRAAFAGAAGARAFTTLGGAGLVMLVAASVPTCSEPCCTYDSLPIPLARAEGGQGELLALVSAEKTGPGSLAVLDTGTPITIWNEAINGPLPAVRRRDLRITSAPMPSGQAPTRAILLDTQTVGGPLGAVAGMTSPPIAVLGGDLLSNFSVEIAFAKPELVLWEQQPATDAFLSSAGYAVLRIQRVGAGEVESSTSAGQGPYQYPASLLVLRGCAAPAAFDREIEPPPQCCAGDERTLATGADLALLLGTGYGPLVLSRSAWNRVTRGMTSPPATTPGPLLVTTQTEPIGASWSTLPRLALVDREADTSLDPGPCVELGRARRLEQVAVRQARNPDHAACALPCDQDPRSDGWAQNSAGYLELGDDLPVAIVDDGERLLQTLRAEVRPNGPEVDGIVGAGVLQKAHVEIDYLNQPSRVIFSCEASAEAAACRAVARCPRLPGAGQTHACFGLPAHALPRMCDNPPACH